MINRTLDNRYTILENVGGGGMADVYRAHDKLLDRFVAVKILKSQFTNDEEFITRFRREAKAAAKLSNPNIVNIYDVGQDEDIYYIVMEYISGETLKEKIQREAPLPVESAVHIAIEIAEALEHAHQNNLVHCDIKPHNILITQTGRVKVTDFGIARAVTSATMTQTGTILGSVHYFSPEQAKGSAIDAKSDIYSLGVVLYEMLTGQVPFQGETPISIALKHLQDEAVPLGQINPKTPPLVEASVMKAMAKDPEARFNNITEFIADLKMAQNYLRDDHTRRIARDDFPTQILPKIDFDKKTNVPEPGVSHKYAAASQKKRKKVWLGGLIFLLVLGFAIGAFLAFGKFWSATDITLPNVVGKQAEAARTILVNKNLRVSMSEANSDTVPPGFVISQYPEAGSIVKEQRMISLVVSRGHEITVVPDLTGLSKRDAELQLTNAGLKVGRVVEEFSQTIAKGFVISQSPRAPTQVGKGTLVDLILSKGAEPRKLLLPDFRGTPLNTVKTQLDSLKLKLGTVSEEISDKYPAGTIIGQNPPPGSEVVEGIPIDFTLAKGGAGLVKRASVQITVPEGPPRQNVQIIVTDINSRRVVYEGVHKPGSRIEKTVEGVGSLRVQVYINGTLAQEQTL